MTTSPALVTDARERRVWMQTAIITAVAIGVYALLRWLPLAGDSLHYTDFGAGQRGFLEFCEPGSPQFAPVDRVHSPVTLDLATTAPLQAGTPSRVVVRLTTASGKAIGEEDLLVVHTRPLHLLVIDESLHDYQHVHPEATATVGEFAFEFTPLRAGRYRVFADFMPRATGRALYAGAELRVAGESKDQPGSPREERLTGSAGGITGRITLDPHPLRLNRTTNLILTVSRDDGQSLVLEDVMDAPAHLVAFDERCSGFAHLHPGRGTSAIAPQTDAGRRLVFTINVPDPGFYRLWAQLKVDGQDVFIPFDLHAVP